MTDDRHSSVLVIGGGFGGIAAAIRLVEEGFDDVKVLEKADRLGGTWRENTYPGCACDVPSAIYSYSFAPNPDWSHAYARQEEIRQYIEDTAIRFGVIDRVRFNTEALGGDWDEDEQVWRVETTQGTYTANVIVAATGPLHEPEIPPIPGLAEFPGTIFHSSHWDHDHDFGGERVAVIGTGASAIQFIPHLQRAAGQLTVFQRTAPWVLPKLDHRMPRIEHELFRRVPQAQRALRESLYHLFELVQLAQRRPRVMRVLQLAGVAHLRAAVRDPRLRAALTPKFAMGCKRILLSNDYYPALQKPNVSVVAAGVAEVRGNVVVDEHGGEHEVDAIVLGTGFKATDPPIAERVHMPNGSTLAKHWDGTPQAYKGTVVTGVPNGFLLVGPNTANGHQSIVTVMEAQLDFVCNTLRHMRANGVGRFEVRPEVQVEYNREVQRALRGTVWNDGGCASYYIDRNGVNSTIYPWTTIHMRRAMAEFDASVFKTAPARVPVAA